jgi:hypothetical protein
VLCERQCVVGAAAARYQSGEASSLWRPPSQLSTECQAGPCDVEACALLQAALLRPHRFPMRTDPSVHAAARTNG